MALQSTTALATITLQAAASEVTFSGIPNTYRDLICTISGTSPYNGQIRAQANGDSTSSYPYVMIWGDGSSSGAGSGTSNGFRLQWIPVGIYYTTTAFFLDYSQSNKNKGVVSKYSGGETGIVASSWTNNSPITSLKFFHEGGNLNSGTTISLYGRIA